MKFQNPKFIKTATKTEHFPQKRLPEIAVVGCSNVGKSTLLGHLFQTKKLVKTSSTPGKTQAINFFNLNEELLFADLPGYGFAKNPLLIRKEIIEIYLKERPNLLLFLIDIRRTPSEEDLSMFQWIDFQQIPTILVLTKADKLNRSQRMTQTKKITHMLKEIPYVHYSSIKNEGRTQLIAMIRSMLSSKTLDPSTPNQDAPCC